MITVAQFCGGVFGLFIAWLINYCFVMYERELAVKEQEELENYKKSLRKTR